MDFDFTADWTRAKVRFELATKDKKPSKKFLGAIRLSSGVEKACKGLEAAIGAPSPNSIAKAEKTYVKAAEDYVRTLRKAAKDEGATENYKDSLNFLEKTLEGIRQKFLTAKRTEVDDVMDKSKGPVREDVEMTFDYTIPAKVIDGLLKSNFTKLPIVVAFATKSAFAVSGADGRTKLQSLAAAQKEAQAALKKYLTAAKAMKSQLKVRMEPKAAWDKAEDFYADAIMAVREQGLQEAMGHWAAAQREAFGPGREADCAEWFKNGALAPQIKQLGDACKEELERLYALEAECEQNKR